MPYKNIIHLIIYSSTMFMAFPIIEHIGFIPGSIIVMIALQLFAGQRNVIAILSVSCITVLVIFSLMRFVLSVPLP